MKSLRSLDRRLGFSLGAVGLLLGMIAPAVVPAFASADSQITSRSVQMSSSGVGATGVSYKATFTPNETGAQNLAIEFCSNTPLIGSACTAPTGMDASAATVTTGTILGSGADVGANFIDFSATLASPTTITFGNIKNPTTSGGATFYARVMVFDTAPHAALVDGSGSETMANIVDDGSVALATTPVIGVTASVLESMTFCVFGDPNNNTGSSNGTANAASYLASLSTSANGPGEACNDGSTSNGGHSNGSPSPSVQLGQVSSSVSALSTATPSYAADWAQLSTNASSGAIVYLKTSNQCVGLHRTSQSSASVCDIPSAGATTGGSLAAGTSGFGLSFGAAVGGGADSNGSVDVNSNYASHYAMLGSSASSSSGQGNSAENGLTQDVTSTYGGFVFGSEGAPLSDQDVPFALGGSISNNTPAGSYSTNLNLVAVGTF